MDESDDSKVVLEGVDLDTEGKYGCEVTTDYPFETVLAKGNVTVVGEKRASARHFLSFDKTFASVNGSRCGSF